MDRASGILLPLFSLPSRHGIGTLGIPAYDFVRFLKKAGQRYWQMLPIGTTDYANSPYQSFSSFAGNPFFIDLDTLVFWGYLTEDEVMESALSGDGMRVDYETLYARRVPLLKKAYSRMNDRDRRELDSFWQTNFDWIDDYALYMALRESHGGAAWFAWEEGLRARDPEALNRAKGELAYEMGYHGFVQMLFYRQWNQLRNYMKQEGIGLIGDLPIYVPYDSADVWAAQDQFLLDRYGKPEAVSGVPPDYFSEEGQLWGSPLYDWEKMKEDGYAWWQRRIRGQAALFDVLRIDHFRALESYWSIPYGDKDARGGKWVKGPGMEWIQTMQNAAPDLKFIAEDLGLLTPEVAELRKESGWPGMEVLEFAFPPMENSAYLPHNHVKNAVVYVGTHDNMTAKQFLKQDNAETRFAEEYLGEASVEALLRAGMMSVSDTFISTMQDWLELDGTARINAPGTTDHNWEWRMQKDAADDELAEKILAMTKRYAR